MTATHDTATNALDVLLANAREAFARGAAERKHAFHQIQIATIGGDGRPRLRTVVLRAFDPDAMRLRFHTDARSPKVGELLVDPRVALLAYNHETGEQARVEGRAIVHGSGPVWERAWAETRPMSRVCYRVALAPSTPITAWELGLPPASREDAEAGREAFRVVEIAADTLDWLVLAHDGHRRAAYRFAEGRVIGRGWVVP